ncbi:RTA1-domain-containing protein [Lentithecium fluviatile CBS 122367]|uniref:RTA1-domain-containing protein n=1 Tax=Lentithecium fluviatile CBS 122367 TaxID=1168545 RepID=A0A6G1IK58_9PLEO|nr:RTA1-domain-containing protein [Lentithecium fluviatile CBS 122367]
MFSSLGDQNDPHKFWDYNPSALAAAVATSVFGFLTLVHAFQLARNRSGFCLPFLIGGVLETIGYAARAGAHNNTESLTPYIVQSLLILLAPIFFAASIYAILGRLIRRVNGDNIAIIHPSVLTRFFVGGGGILSQAREQSAMNFGKNTILVGLGLQIYIFCFFVKIAARFHRDMQRHPTDSALSGKFPWRRYMVLLYVACACIGIRNTYRVVEYAMGKNLKLTRVWQDGFLLVHEWPLYVGDFAFMAITLIVCLAWYDVDIRTGNKSVNGVELEPLREV